MSIQLINAEVIKHEKLTTDTYLLTLIGKGITNCQYGQFINLKIDGIYLRRPISICTIDAETISICYKVVGKGTKRLSAYQVGDQIDCLVGLGHGFELPLDVKKVTLVGGGIGVPPLVGWYRYLKSNTSLEIDVVLGFQQPKDAIFTDEFENAQVVFDSEKQNVINALEKIDVEYVYSCGPSGMLEALAKKYPNGQMLLEARMGCGFGACMGCSKQTGESKYKRVCVEGPMFTHEEVRYDINN